MSLYGKFTDYCTNCGKPVKTDACGQNMWRSSTKWMVCGKECHDDMAIKDTRSILGKDTMQKTVKFPETGEEIPVLDPDYVKDF